MTTELIFDRSSYLDPTPLECLNPLRNSHDHHGGESTDSINHPGSASTPDISASAIGSEHHLDLSSLDNRTHDDLVCWDEIPSNQLSGHDTGHGTDSAKEGNGRCEVSGNPNNNTRLHDGSSLHSCIRSVSEVFYLDENGTLWEEGEDRYSIRTDGSTVSTFARDDLEIRTGNSLFGEEVDRQREPIYHQALDDGYDEAVNLQFQKGGVVMFKNDYNSPGDKTKKKRAKPSLVRPSASHICLDTPTIHEDPRSKKEHEMTTVFSAWSPTIVIVQFLTCVFILTVCAVILRDDDTLSEGEEETKMLLPCLDLSHFYPIAAWYKNTDRETNERFKAAGIQRVKGDKNNYNDVSCEVSTSLLLGLMARNEYDGVGGQVTLVAKESGPTLGYSTYTLSIKAMRDLRNVLSNPQDLVIAQEGNYFVYFGLELNYQDGVCRKFRFKTAIAHLLIRAASGQPPKALLGSEYTCSESHDTEKATMFTGGLFHLRTNDRLFIQVSSAEIIGDLNYFGVFRLPTH